MRASRRVLSAVCTSVRASHSVVRGVTVAAAPVARSSRPTLALATRALPCVSSSLTTTIITTSNPPMRTFAAGAGAVSPASAFKKKVEFPSGSVMAKTEDDLFRSVEFPTGTSQDNKYENAAFREVVNELFQKHKPSSHPFFAALAAAPKAVVTNPKWLREFYIRYQAAMHSTRAAVYFAPHLNAPTLRQRKIDILGDDDTTGGKDSHHKQLENMFRRFGATLPEQDWFGDLEPLAAELDPATAKFVRNADRLYRQTTGAWCIAEVLSDDWLSALAKAFSAHFPDTIKEPYFDEVFTGHIEIVHMLETVALTENILHRYPKLLEPTIAHAREMAAQVDALWDNLQELVERPEKYLK